MLNELEQMIELNRVIEEAVDKGDIDRVVKLMKRRKELTDHMGNPSPDDPDIQSGKVQELLREIVKADGEIEAKIRNLMGTLQKAIQTVQGERKVVKGYLSLPGSDEPKLIDREG